MHGSDSDLTNQTRSRFHEPCQPRPVPHIIFPCGTYSFVTLTLPPCGTHNETQSQPCPESSIAPPYVAHAIGPTDQTCPNSYATPHVTLVSVPRQSSSTERSASSCAQAEQSHTQHSTPPSILLVILQSLAALIMFWSYHARAVLMQKQNGPACLCIGGGEGLAAP
mmetsp:Transcript_10746/g.27974  ORF Transcript_10746/g.27974 Transcript_10746/m.27974 type:complete len:166 (+) Transcript_10746:254-751(+)|eukprot:scaffold9915_cov20-Tisochrysis_lutea.AAC.1